MDGTLLIHVNRDGPKSVAPEASEIDVDGPFDVVFENHGPPAHVHMHMDDALAAVAQVGDTNWYVENGEALTIPVDVESIDEVTGRLKVATGYGSSESFVDVTVAEGSGGVQVDEELSKPKPQPQDEVEPEDTSYLIPAAFMVLGLIAAAVLTFLVDDVYAIAIGVAAVVGAVATAMYLLYAA